jgi:sugar diacid utilization regulator
VVSLQELIQLGLLAGFQPVVPGADLGRIVSNVVILEYESDRGTYDGFGEGDLVLTSLFFAKDRPEAILPAFENLLTRRVSAVAVKSVYYRTLPAPVLARAEAARLPVFFFSKTYMEDIILNVNECIKSHQRSRFLEQKIDELLLRRLTPDQVADAARDICPGCGDFVTAFYVEVLDEHEDAQLFRFVNRLLYRTDRAQGDGLACFFVKYRQGVLVFYHTSSDNPPAAVSLTRGLLDLLGGDRTRYRLGGAGDFHPLSELDVCLQKSLYAWRVARKDGKSLVCHQELGLSAFILPLSENRSAVSHHRALTRRIEAYDRKFHSGLMETLTSFVRHDGEIAAAAETLHLHPNTVRYRLQRARELLGLEHDRHFRETVSLLIRLRELCEEEEA